VNMVAKVASLLETVLGDGAEELAEKHGVIKRKRNFTGTSLLRMLVLTLLRKPRATFADWSLTAAQLGVLVTATAVEKRFTPSLVDFLKETLQRTLQEVVVAQAISGGLLDRFTAVYIGDSPSLSLPDERKDEFAGRGGTGDCCQAALKLQVRWNLKTGELPPLFIEDGKASDMKSPLAHQPLRAGSMEIFDLGYFSVERFRRLNDHQAFFISRLQHGVAVFDADDRPVLLRTFLEAKEVNGIVDVRVKLGKNDRFECRLVALRVPEEIANRRRQKARENAGKHGRVSSQEYLELLGWSLFVTNASEELLTWREMVVLYRSRWQIELLFKLWKSHNQLAHRRPGATATEVMAVLWAKLIGILLQHWLLLTATWLDHRRSLMKAVRILREWMVSIIRVLDQRESLEHTITDLQANIRNVAKIQSRKKHPSHFQLLQNPALLDWNP
jgi:hypothetical protein